MIQDIKIIAGILLGLRIIATFFLTLVLRRQYRLIKNTQTDLDATRKLLFAIVGITFLGQFVPIIIDFAGVWGLYKVHNPQPLGVAYSMSNATTAAISALGWWFLYKLISQENIKLEKDHKQELRTQHTKDIKR